MSRSGVVGSMSTVLRSIVLSGSVSSSVILKVTGCPSSVLSLLSVAIGGWLLTVTVILAGFDVLLFSSAIV